MASEARSSCEIVELSAVHAREEGRDLGSSVDQHRALGLPGVTHRHRPIGEFGQLNAVAARIAHRTLTPGHSEVLYLHVQMVVQEYLRMQGFTAKIVYGDTTQLGDIRSTASGGKP
jgi:hypothetical protein